jgi:hypothetical protein
VSEPQADDFDMQAAWMRRFKADAQSNIQPFALRLKEAMPEHVTIHEHKPLFGKPKIIGVTVAIDEHRYTLEIAGGKLKSSVSLTVHEIALNTKHIDPTEWFAQLSAETRRATEHAQNLSRSLSAFMSS